MEFRILGPLEVIEDGQTLELGGQKQRALLTVLLLEANRAVSSDRLIEALWDDAPPETAQKALQVHVSQLRKTLGRERLETKPSGYLLRVGEHELDLARFQRLREAGESAEALSLWRGSPLSDVRYQRFAGSEIARLEELRLACLEDRIEADLAAGRHSDLVGELEALVRENPLRQRLLGQLMLALYRSGREPEALDVYKGARTVLVEELGIEPSRDLRELQQAILRQDPALDLSASTASRVESARGVFVGRAHELAQLLEGLDDCLAGRGGLFLLVGEPGIGKSRLADELIEHARMRRTHVLVGRCWEAGGAPAYWPWLQALRMHLEIVEPDALRAQLSNGGAELAQILPELRELFPDLPQPSPEVEGARFRLFAAAARFLRSAAAARPIVLVLDDLHVADEPSLLLLRFVAGQLAQSRILVVGTYRDVDPTVRDPLASTLAELSRERVTRRIVLAGLSREDISQYVELSVDESPPAAVTTAIYEETEGNPLFVGEVVSLLAAEGRLSQADDSGFSTLGVPQGVREVIGRRLRRLSEECMRVLVLASVLGREFALDALQKVSDTGSDELLEVLDEAVAARLLTSVPGARGRLRFGHALIRETLYEGLTTPRRVQLHRRAAEALEELYERDPQPRLAELAYHFFEAAPGGDVDKALAYARRAGDRALELLAYEEAARLYELALQALELRQTVDASERCELLLALGDALARAGSTPKAKKSFLAAAELARKSRLPAHLARAALGYGGRFPWLRAGSDTQLVPLLEEALASLDEGEATLRVRLLARLAGALRDQRSLEPRSTLGRQAVEIARGLGDPDTLGYALASLFTATWGPDVDELLAIVEEVTRLAEETGEAERAVDACWLRRIVWFSLGDVALVEQVAEDHRALADDLKQPSQQWYDAVMRSTWALFRGSFGDAEQIAEEALRIGEQAQSWDAGFSYRILIAVLRREQGRMREVEELVRRTAEEYGGYRSFRCLEAVLECEIGDPDAARRALDGLAADDFAALPRDCEWIFCLCALAEVAAHLEDRDRTGTIYRLLLPYARMNAVAAGEVAVGSVARYLGILASTAARWDEAARHFEDALEMNERMGARPWVARTQEDYGRMLLRRDGSRDRARAEDLLATALATYRELGMAPASQRS